MSPCRTHVRWEEVQKRAFTHWVNSQLAKRDIKIEYAHAPMSAGSDRDLDKPKALSAESLHATMENTESKPFSPFFVSPPGHLKMVFRVVSN